MASRHEIRALKSGGGITLNSQDDARVGRRHDRTAAVSALVLGLIAVASFELSIYLANFHGDIEEGFFILLWGATFVSEGWGIYAIVTYLATRHRAPKRFILSDLMTALALLLLIFTAILAWSAI